MVVEAPSLTPSYIFAGGFIPEDIAPLVADLLHGAGTIALICSGEDRDAPESALQCLSLAATFLNRGTGRPLDELLDLDLNEFLLLVCLQADWHFDTEAQRRLQ